MCLSVCKKDFDSKDKYMVLYNNITNPDDALLLSQLAMHNKADTESIFILPGWSLGIDTKNTKDYRMALMLAKNYKLSDGD